MKTMLAIWSAFLLVWSGASFAEPKASGYPAFDCNKARTQVEHTICQDATLANLDVMLNDNYGNLIALARTNPSDADYISRTQKAWVKDRDTCKTMTCVRIKYYERIDALCSYGRKHYPDLVCLTAEQAMMNVK